MLGRGAGRGAVRATRFCVLMANSISPVDHWNRRRALYRSGPKMESLELRIERQAKRRDNGCLEWGGHRNRWGYGKIGIGRNTTFTVHRVVWELLHGKIPCGLFVLHKCDNPPCVDPNHLFLGTAKENTLDAVRKGRMARGERASQSKLTPDQVREIRRIYASGGIGCHTLAKQFSVSPPSIHSIVRKKNWGWLQ